MTAIVVLTKAPAPGASKTRLCPPLTHHEAASVAAAALHDTLAAVARTRIRRRVVALDGAPGPWCEGIDVIPQRGCGLAGRIAAAFEDAGGPAVLIGMDTPQVTPDLLDEAVGALDGDDAVFGPALDGGYWAIGLRRPDRRLFDDVPMSTPETGSAQLRCLEHFGLSVATLPELRDVDTIEDARAVAEQVPGSRFASALERTGSWRRCRAGR